MSIKTAEAVALQIPKRSEKTICALMTVYLDPYGKKGEYFLRRAIESILCQTWGVFRFLIMQDGPCGSKFNSAEIVNSYQDGRVDYHITPEHIGLTESLNLALPLITEDYILRQDADDISHPRRLFKLLTEINKDPMIGAIGCNYGILNEQNEHMITNGSDPQKVKLSDLAGTIAGGGSMLRTEAVKKVGGWKYEYAQDVYMWVMLRKAGYQICSVKETLYWYRTHKGQISQAKREQQKRCHQEIIKKECA